MELRPYQAEAKDAVYKYFRENGDKNPCVVLPTGAGKTPLLATLCKDIIVERAKKRGVPQRVLVVAHVKELLEQAYDKIKTVCPSLNVGIYSSGLHKRDTKNDVIVAGVQSIYSKAFDLGKFDLIIVDEAHLIPRDGDGMYQTLLKNERLINPNVKLVGLTATPYRMRDGLICCENGFLNDVCYEANVKDLIEQGYLSKVVTRKVKLNYDSSTLNVSGGEFIQKEVDALVSDDQKLDGICREIVLRSSFEDRKKVLIFAANVEHAERTKEKIKEYSGENCEAIFGSTPADERASILEKFKKDQGEVDLLGNATKPLRFLVNVNVLTTGFDNPKVDHVVILRPTASPGLYYQMVGRGFRLSEGKEYCLVSDYGQNIDRHGPVDKISGKKKKKKNNILPIKVCGKCDAIVSIGTRKCPDCGYEFPFEEQPLEEKLERTSSKKNVVSGNFIDEEYEIDRVDYFVHEKTRDDGTISRTVRITYRTTGGRRFNEWICPEHEGNARRSFVGWWVKRSLEQSPFTVDEVVDAGNNGELAPVLSIVVRYEENERYGKIIKHNLGEIPELKEKNVNRCARCCYFNNKECLFDIENPIPVKESDVSCERFSDVEDLPF